MTGNGPWGLGTIYLMLESWSAAKAVSAHFRYLSSSKNHFQKIRVRDAEETEETPQEESKSLVLLLFSSTSFAFALSSSRIRLFFMLLVWITLMRSTLNSLLSFCFVFTLVHMALVIYSFFQIKSVFLPASFIQAQMFQKSIKTRCSFCPYCASLSSGN